MNNKILSTSIGSFLQMGFSHLGTLIITIALTRILSVEEFGVISLVNTIVFFFIILVSLGVPSSLAKYLSASREYEYSIETIRQSTVLLMPWVIVLSIVYLLSYSYLSSNIFSFDEFERYKYVIILLVWLELLRLFIEKISHGTMNMAVAAKLSGYSAMLMIILMVPVAYVYHTSYTVLWAKSLALLLPILPMMLLLRVRLKSSMNEEGAISVPPKIEILKYGFPLSLISIAGFGFLQTDIFFIAYYLSSEHVAYYSVAMFIFVRLITVPRALGNGLAPVLANTEDEESNVEYYKQSLLLAIVFVAPIILYVVINGRELLSFIFGSQYEASYDVLVILCIYFFLGSMLAIVNPIMDFSGKASVRAKAVIIGAITNIVLDIFLIPGYGLSGAAVATVAGYLVFFIIVMLNIHSSILRSLFKYTHFYRLFFIVSLLFLPAMYLIRYNSPEYSILVNGLILLLLYPISLMYFGIVDFKKLYLHFKSR